MNLGFGSPQLHPRNLQLHPHTHQSRTPPLCQLLDRLQLGGQDSYPDLGVPRLVQLRRQELDLASQLGQLVPCPLHQRQPLFLVLQPLPFSSSNLARGGGRLGMGERCLERANDVLGVAQRGIERGVHLSQQRHLCLFSLRDLGWDWLRGPRAESGDDEGACFLQLCSGVSQRGLETVAFPCQIQCGPLGVLDLAFEFCVGFCGLAPVRRDGHAFRGDFVPDPGGELDGVFQPSFHLWDPRFCGCGACVGLTQLVLERGCGYSQLDHLSVCGIQLPGQLSDLVSLFGCGQDLAFLELLLSLERLLEPPYARRQRSCLGGFFCQRHRRTIEFCSCVSCVCQRMCGCSFSRRQECPEALDLCVLPPDALAERSSFLPCGSQRRFCSMTLCSFCFCIRRMPCCFLRQTEVGELDGLARRCCFCSCSS